MLTGGWMFSVFLSGILVNAIHIPTNTCTHKVINKEMNISVFTPPVYSRNVYDTIYPKWRVLEWLVSRNKVSMLTNEFQDTNDIIMSNPYIAMTFFTM